jgi:hypothetical protein
MRFYPRNDLSRADAQKGGGHIGNHSVPDHLTSIDRMKRYEPSLSAANVNGAYGGSGS